MLHLRARIAARWQYNTHRHERGKQPEERDEMTNNQVVWLTQESHDRLKAELDQLIANRPIILSLIHI